MDMPDNTQYNYGFVLSGGAARGFAHLGVAKALEEEGIRPDILSGASAGSIVGAYLADGYLPEEILEIFLTRKLFQFVQFTLPHLGFLSLEGLEEVLEETLHAKTFEDLKIPLYISATNCNKGKIVYFHKGPLIQCILASSSIPIVFQPRIINKQYYVDGGVMDNLPVKPLQGKCKKLVGVWINPIGEEKEIKGMVHLAERTFHLAMAGQVEMKKPFFDIFIEPPELYKYGLMDIKKGREMFETGYKTAKEVLAGIQRGD
ncbi:MAG: patatin-like phospholipase family protein [Bacteroidales bacterium]|nr:patatin-like phospholipase family protein [Bacteroidales bacterium]